MANPTEKQINFAKAISEKLGIELPEEYTSKAYWQYLNEHRDAYYDKVNAEAGQEKEPKPKPKSKWSRNK